jgi:phage FluMu protein Com
MNTQIHPTFSQSFKRFFISGFLISAALFAGGFFLRKHGFEIISHFLLISFCISLIATLGGLGYMIYNVKCPKCGMKTQTTKDPTQSYWQAQCKSCDTTWHLDIGTGTNES